MKKNLKCRICGRHFDEDQVIRIPGWLPGAVNCESAGAYICHECARTKGYHEGKNKLGPIQKTRCKNGKLITAEIEMIPHSEMDELRVKAALAKVDPKTNEEKGWRFEDDCSLPAGGFEAIQPRSYSLKGDAEKLATVQKLADTLDPRCGAHINLSFDTWAREDYERVVNHSDWLFAELEAYFEKHEAETTERCGRFFGEWAGKTSSHIDHYNWLNLTHCLDSEDETLRFEWRMAKINDPRQYVDLCKAVVKVFEAVDTWFLKGSVKHKRMTKKEIAQKLVDAWNSGWNRNAQDDIKYGRV